MLIRTQDKKILFDIQGMQFYSNGAGKIIGSNTSNPSDGYVLCGAYSTKEKEIKVLDMIQEKYESFMSLQGGQMMTQDLYINPNFWVLPKVFQMPQDSEVLIDET